MTGLTTLPHDPLLDLDPWVGQRQCTFRFDWFNGVTGQILGNVTPIRNGTLTHDTTRTIKRQLNLNFGVVDTAAIDPITDRLNVFMVFPDGTEYPLGTYMFTDQSKELWTSGELSNVIMNDEMFLVDQQITVGIAGNARNTISVITETLSGLPITFEAEATPYLSVGSWTPGTRRGAGVLEDLAVTGDFFSPWFGNDSVMHFIRSFDPATKVPDFDFDEGNKVIRTGITMTSDLLTAPNRFVVISNTANDPRFSAVGTADVSPNAPHSFAKRGFYVPSVQDLQLVDPVQAQAVAENLVKRQTIFERTTLSTAPDPRHDSYNVIRWQGDLWLELAWGMALIEGGAMTHLLRKAYAP